MALFTRTGHSIMAGPQINPRFIGTWMTEVERITEAAITAGLVFATKAALDADLAHAANSGALVIGDSTSNDGLYRKSGASGSGSWIRVGDVPGYSFVVASDNSGSANAIAATTALPVNESQLITVPIATTNTASPVTVAFNGGTALTIKTQAGNNPATGGLVSGSEITGRISGTTFRMISDQSSAAIQAAAEAAQAAAEAAQAAAEAVMTTVIDPQFSTRATAEAYSPTVAPLYIRTAGDVSAGDGLGRLYKKAASEPAHDEKLSITLSGGGTQWYEEAEVPYGVFNRGNLNYQPDIVLLATGQSNMAGSGEGGDMTTDPNVLAWDPVTSAWVTADPTASPFTVNNNNNLAFHAAKKLASVTGRTVRLIIVAVGGLPIARWISSTSGDDGTANDMWDQITTEVPLALAAAGLTYVDRVLWHQGESDSGRGTIVYRDEFISVKDQMKAESWWLEGHTFMAAGEMSDDPSNDDWQQTFAIRLACEIDGDIALVPSAGLEGEDTNNIHFTGPSLVTFGHRYADVCLLPYAPYYRPEGLRHSITDQYFTLETDGSGDFDDLEKAFDFFGTITFGFQARGRVTIGAGTWEHTRTSGFRVRLQSPAWEFTGEVAGGYSQPVKGDFGGTYATDLAAMQAKVLTEINFTSAGMIGGGPMGHWKHVLFTTDATSTTNGYLIRSNDPQIPAEPALSSIRMTECILMGAGGTNASAIRWKYGSAALLQDCTIAHCGIGIWADSTASVSAIDTVMAYNVQGDNRAELRAFIDANSQTTTKTSGGSFTAATAGYIDARSAENNVTVSETTNGIVEN